MNTINHHPTRDHRFAYISAGDIGHWAKATTGFARPNCGKKEKTVARKIDNLQAIKEFCAKLTPTPPDHDPHKIVLIASDDDGGVVAAMAKCDKVVQIASDRINISDAINRVLMPKAFKAKKN